ncbi:ferritin-like domain-containing protein [Streptomyces buecherae]|uniref:ferritin-like domain-containing protein n=1 Tax=Streptomyces buecherae TaxID=2763006 RepID=UPI0036CFB26B
MSRARQRTAEAGGVNSAKAAEGSVREQGRDASTEPTLRATQAALAAEHAAVYGYGVVGGRIEDQRLPEAREGLTAHRARRDALERDVRALKGEPVSSAAAYALPFPVPDAAAAARLAGEIEARLCAVYADLVRAAEGGARREAAAALREAAVRAVRWRGSSVTFPGLTERAAGGAPSTAASGVADAL